MIKKKSRLHILIGICLIFSLCSCATVFSAYNVTLPKDSDVTKGDVKDKIPFRAGLYLSPSAKNYTQQNSPFGMIYNIHNLIYYIGDAFSNNCEKMLKNIFQHVVIIDETDVAVSKKNVDVIVAPELLELTHQLKVPEGGTSNAQVYQMIVKWNIASPEGKTIYTTTVTGESVYKDKFMGFSVSAFEEKFKEYMLQVFRAQFDKAQDDIYTNTWWKKQWWKMGN